jgi:hypothetical protein
MSLKTVEHMTRHYSHDMVDEVMVHLSDSEAYKHFNRVHPHFSMESRNMYLGLCIDRLNPFGLFIVLYSYWSVLLTIYNLSLGMCKRLEIMFLSIFIPYPNNSDRNIVVCLHPLIDELRQL